MKRAAALALLLGACAPGFAQLPTPDELNRLPLAELYASYPELRECGPESNPGFANTASSRSAQSLIDAWGEPDDTSISAYNAMFWMIPLAPVTSWSWTRFDRSVDITVWRPLLRGYQATVWMCDFGELRPR
jgi:hypothetical protein